jgi:hypothetical protein
MNASAEAPVIHSDRSLARRLEGAEARASAEFIDTRARLSPGSGACWIEVAGAYALYDGPASPITQTFGLGIFEPVTNADLEVIERFFQSRGAPVHHEISPLADPGLLPLLNKRGYQPIEFTSVMFRPIGRDLRLGIAPDNRIHIREAPAQEHESCARVAAQAWKELAELGEEVPELMRVGMHRPSARTYVAELDGKPVAVGVLCIHNGVAIFAGAGTIPEARNQGAQLALLEQRLRRGADEGCDIALMGAPPGSASQRNAQRHGFRIAYTRVKWRRA